jgi:uncharacterized repeat protein (TIGR01451 family)
MRLFANSIKPFALLGRSSIVVAIVAASLTLPLTTSTAAAAAAPTCGSGTTPNVVALADPSFFIDSDTGLDSTYAGYTVRSGSSAENNLWLGVSNFTGGSVGLAAAQPANVALTNIPANSAATSYLLLKAAAASTTAQTHTVTLYRGYPTASNAICQRTYTYNGVYETIKALANKVTSVTANNPGPEAKLGDAVTVTVTGNTGTLGAGPSFDPGVLSYAPNALGTFPAGGWRLEKTSMNISPDGNAAPITYVDRLYLSGASGGNRPYTAHYTFRAIGPVATASAVKPIQYIASGTQVKHTDIGGGVVGSLPAVSSIANLQLSKTVSASVLAAGGGDVSYDVTATNHGGSAGTMDRIVDSLPAGAVYKSGTSTLGGRATADPAASGQTLTWPGPVVVPAGGTTTLHYEVTLPSTPGDYVNAAVAHFGTATLDASRDVTTSNPATATTTVLGVSGSADAVNDTTTTSAGTAIAVNVLANDSSSGNFPLSVQAVATPSSGTASIRPDGTILYTPAAGFAGAATFGYTVSDGYSTDNATVTVTVAPAARNDLYATNRSTTLNAASVLTNDSCSGCTVSLVTNVATGTLTLNSNGTFSYVAPNQNGTATFTYRVTTAGGATATATATIFVNAAGPDYATTPNDTDVVIGVTANDTCVGNGGNCNVTANVAPVNGAVTYNGTNATYNPNAGFWGIDSFQYNLNGNATATVTVFVAPQATTKQTTFNQQLSGNLSAAAFTGASVTACSGCSYTVAAAPAHALVSVTAGTGAFTYSPDTGYAGSDAFTYRVADPITGLSVTAVVNITVGPDAVADTYTALVRNDLVLNVLANDQCPATCSVSITANPSTGSVINNGNGTLTFSSAAAHDIGIVTFQYQVTSSVAVGITDTATVTVNVEGAVSDSSTTTPGIAKNIDVLGNDPCIDCTVSAVTTPSTGSAAIQPNGSITFTPPAGFTGQTSFGYSVTKNGNSTTANVTVDVLPLAVDDTYAMATGGTLEIDPRVNDLCTSCVIDSAGIASAGGSVSINSSKTAISFAPAAAAGQTETFSYTIRNSNNQTSTATVHVNLDSPPVATADSGVTPASVPVIVDVLANDACSSCEPGIAADASNGTVVFRADGRVQYTPAARFSGIDIFEYVATDPVTGLSATAVVSIKVLPLAVDDAINTARNMVVNIPVTSNDSCTTCTITIITPPVNGNAVVNGSAVNFTPTNGFEGSDVLRYRVTDGSTNEFSEADVTIYVSNATPDAATVAHNGTTDVDVLANDTCPSCTIQSTTQPTNGVTSIVGGKVRYQPANGFWGIDTFTYLAGSGGQNSLATVTMLVAPPARVLTTGVNSPLNTDLLATAPCATCVFSIASAPIAGDVDLDGQGTSTYTPPLNGTPDDTITYRVEHPASGLRVTSTLTVLVRASSVTVTTVVVNDDGGTNVVGDFSLSLNGNSVTSGQSNSYISGVAYTVGQTVIAGYVQTGIACTDTTANSPTTHPFTLPGGHHVSCVATVDDVANTPQVSIDKSAGTVIDANSTGHTDAGDTVTYTYAVVNSGNVALSGLTVDDDRMTTGILPSCPGGTNVIASLNTGLQQTCTATYTLTQADLDAGTVSSTGTVIDDGATGGVLSDSDSTTVLVTQVNSISTVKSVTSITDSDADSHDTAGDVVHYSVVTTNTGTTTVSTVSISDPLTSGVQNCAALTPGATCTLITSYTLAQADVDAGSVTNTATATASAPGSTPLTSSHTITTSLSSLAANLVLTKHLTGTQDLDNSGARSSGDVLTFTITAKNTGNKTATNVVVTDILTNATQSCTSLAPAADCVLVTTHTITNAEALAGSVINNASVTSSNAATASTSLTVSVTTPTPQTTTTTAPPTTTSTTTTSTTTTSTTAAPPPSTTTPAVDGSVTHTISGVIWFDSNKNGARDPAEPVIPGANVTLQEQTSANAFRSASFRAAAAAKSTVTGADGSYKFTDVAAGNYDVVASAKANGLSAAWDTDGNLDWLVSVSVASTDLTADFAGTGASTLTGIVTDTSNGQVIAGAELSCTWSGVDTVSGTEDDVTFTAVTNADGTYSINGVPFGQFDCVAVDVSSGKTTEFNSLVQTPGTAIANVVLGAPTAVVPLATTGFDVRLLGIVGLGMLTTGVALMRSAPILRRN